MANNEPLLGLQHRLIKSEALRRVIGVDGATLAVAPRAQAFAIAGLHEVGGGPLVVVAATQRDATTLRDDLACFLGSPPLSVPGLDAGPVALLPSWDTLPLERVSPETSVMGQRLALRWRLASPNPPAIVVASVRALLQRLTPHVVDPVVLRLGMQQDLEELVSSLVAQGYRRESQVEHRGELTVRGGIVDIFGSTASAPVRVDLFGDEIDRLTTFDASDQRARDAVDEAWFFGCREFVLNDQDREQARRLSAEKPWASSAMSRLAEGAMFDGMEGWLGMVVPGVHLLSDALPDKSSIVIVDPRRTRDRALELLEEEAALVNSLVSTWSEGDESPEVEAMGLHADFDRLFAQSVAPVISLPTTPSSEGEPQLGSAGFPPMTGDAARLVEHMTHWLEQKFTVVALGVGERSANRLSDVLSEEGIAAPIVEHVDDKPGISIGVSSLSQGFVLPEFRLAILSEPDLTGRRVPHRPARSQQQVTDGFFDDLGIGSFVVHRQHGVARFSGVTSRSIGGTTRDYMVLEFRGDDRLYLPVDQIETVTPYSGGESPALSRMGGSDWQRTRSKAKAAASEIAEELVALYQARLTAEGFQFSADTPWQEEMEAAFPYTPTPDQRKAIEDIKADMETPRPMDRLVCADVGFGKTEIAVRAAFKAVQDGKQVALLVPTTLLASQHHQTLIERFGGYPLKVALLSRFLTDAQVKGVRHGLSDGSVDVVVGTHRLLSEDIEFKDLGLLIVDEEQRFGVSHKEAVKRMSSGIDVLTLSANPIPRTLEMALTGIRDLSMVTTPPTDRRPILTHVGERDERAITEAIRRELLREGQVFYVHNRVSDIEDAARRVRRLVPEARVAVAHGQMDEGTLERVVLDFSQRNADVLVCTTIVESGIDMPSVNTLVVGRADLLGLGQLHQLRGRVGRSGQRAYAYLFYPEDKVLSEQAYERLRTIGEHTDLGSGFKIAMRDLEIRGSGNLLGRDQSGHVAAVGYDLYVQLVAEAVAEARGVVPEEVALISIDVPGDAHLPASYVAKEDARLEAYRRLASTTTDEEVRDVGDEWIDRYGPLPKEAEGLIDLALLRTTCLEVGISEISVLPARTGGRSVPLAKISPLHLTASAQVRILRLFGDRAYDEANATLRVDLSQKISAPVELRTLILDLLPTAKQAAKG